MLKSIIIYLIIFFMFSCESSSHIRTYRIEKTHLFNKQYQNDIRNSQSLSISWKKPESWIYSKGSSMRIASFDVPFSNGIGDLSVMELGGEGGGFVANVNRWRGQIGLNHLEENKIMEQTLIGESALGQYYKFKLDNKSNNKAILAAILPMIKSTLYIKLTASIDGVSEIEKDFNTFCSSFKPGNN